MTAANIEINGRPIGSGLATYIVAELSSNHEQRYEDAVSMVHAAHEAGADAVKLQTYTADTITIDSDLAHFQIRSGLWQGHTLYSLYEKAFTPWEWQPKLKALADELGIDLFSAPFDDTAVDFLESMEVPVFKVASFENVDLPLLRRIARTGKPIIMSTGMATLAEIAEAVQTIRDAGGAQLAILKCTSSYPASPEEMNLRTIPHMMEAFGVPVGLSDHTLGTAVPIAAVALGATLVEKHFTLSRDTPGLDNPFSLEPHEFKSMVDSIRDVEKALGGVRYQPTQGETRGRGNRRSLFVVQDIGAGEPFTCENVRSIRPGNGLHTRHLDDVIGRHASRDIQRGTPLAWEQVG